MTKDSYENDPKAWFSKYGPRTNVVTIWVFVRNPGSQSSSQTH